VLIAAALAGPAIAEDDYFHLESGRIYAPGDKDAGFDLYSSIEGTVDIRVYAIADPAAFFTAQKDWHNPMSPNSPEMKNRKGMSVFDRFVELVRLMSARYRTLFRRLTSSGTRKNMVDNLGIRGYRKQLDKNAEIPLLKGYKLIARWKHKVKPNEENPEWYTNERIRIPVSRTGAYLIEVGYGDAVAYTVVLVSGMRFIDKSIDMKKVIFVCDAKSGKPVRGAVVTLLENSSRVKKMERRTDSSGIAAFRKRRDASYRIMITRGRDFIIGEQYGYYWEGDNTKVYLYTDRPIYRPGHTVHFKGVVRSLAGDKYIFKSGETVTIVVNDPDWNKVAEISAETNENGTINGSFKLGEEPPLGEYNIQTHYRDNNFYGNFRVEEYKKPEYKVTVTTDKPSYVAGDIITAAFAADYYFGEPVANAKLKYKVYKARYYEPWWSEYDYGWYIAAEEGVYTYDYERVDEGELALDEKGRGKLTISASGNMEHNVIYKIVGEVEDESHHAVAGYSSVKVARALFDVSIETSSYIYRNGDTAVITVRAADILGKPADEKLDIKVVNTVCKSVSRNHNSRSSANKCSEEVIFSKTVSSGKKGQRVFRLKLEKSGSYRITVTTKDSRGNAVREKSYFYLWDDTPYWWYGAGGSDEIELKLDKKVYMQGDKAKVMVTLPVPDATLLFSVEGGDLYRYNVMTIKGKAAMIDLPIKNRYAPNIFLEAHAVFNGSFYKGESEIVIPPADKFLKVEVEAEKKKYHPGDKAKLNITLRDSKGDPVKGEVSVGIVDEAIYGLAPEAAPGIERFFYGKRYNRVETIYSYEFYMYGYSQMRPLTLARRHRDTITRAALKTKEDVRVRRKFKDTMEWFAVVKTDAEGHATVEAECPDNLTTWRVTARAVDADTRVGQSVSRFLVRKDLILRLITPRFFRGRDNISLTTIVHNYLEKDTDVKLSLEADGLKIDNPGDMTVRVPARQEKSVSWSAKVASPGTVRVKGVALSKRESDAVELTIPALPHGAAIGKSWNLTAAKKKQSVIFNAVFPFNTQPETRKLTLSVSPSIVGELYPSLKYLTAYPYGCVEQTMSSFFPNVIVSHLMKELGAKPGDEFKELPKMVDAGLRRLYDFQHGDGGWGWWKDDDTDPLMTAYVLLGLTEAKKAGVSISDSSYSRGMGKLKQMLEDERINLTNKYYILYVLSLGGQGDPALAKRQFELRATNGKEVTDYGLALLILALKNQGSDKEAAVALGELISRAKNNDHWEGDRQGYFWYDDPVEATAYGLKALLAVNPKHEMILRTVKWLLRTKPNRDRWNSTRDTSIAIFGLVDYLTVTKEYGGNFNVKLYAGEKLLKSIHLGKDDVFRPPMELSVDNKLLTAGGLKIKAVKSGAGILHLGAVAEYYSTAEGLKASQAGFSVRRKYWLLQSKQTDKGWIYTGTELSDNSKIRLGDLVLVSLDVSSNAANEYIMIEDYLPSGFEVVRDTRGYDVRIPGLNFYEYKDSYNRWFSNMEIRDEKVAFFSRYFNPHRWYDSSYIMRAEMTGVFHVMPTEAGLMYYPKVRGNSDELVINVTDGE